VSPSVLLPYLARRWTKIARLLGIPMKPDADSDLKPDSVPI
jgi:hypothetical protein